MEAVTRGGGLKADAPAGKYHAGPQASRPVTSLQTALEGPLRRHTRSLQGFPSANTASRR